MDGIKTSSDLCFIKTLGNLKFTYSYSLENQQCENRGAEQPVDKPCGLRTPHLQHRETTIAKGKHPCLASIFEYEHCELQRISSIYLISSKMLILANYLISWHTVSQ